MKKYYTRATIDQNENDTSRIITGKAVTFGTRSQYLGYWEYINKDAITQELIDNSDVIANFQHDDTRMLARWTRGSGTLSLSLHDDGLYFEFEAPDTTLGNDILWHIRHGNLNRCSFAFTVPSDESFRWFKDENDELCAEVMQIDGLYDVSIVVTPAYEDTFVDARDFDLESIKRSLDKPQPIVSEEVKEVIEQEVNDPEERANDNETVKTSFFKDFYIDLYKNTLDYIK